MSSLPGSRGIIRRTDTGHLAVFITLTAIGKATRYAILLGLLKLIS